MSRSRALFAVLCLVGFLGLLPSSAAAADGNNQACTLRIPAQPLSAQGLATPYQLSGPCHEADPNTAAFVQATVLDPVSGQVSVYNPLVIDQGSSPAVAPVLPSLPTGAVVGVWVGFNGNLLQMGGPGAGFQQGSFCYDGVGGSLFGQNIFCNAPQFFRAANTAIQSGKLTVPALGVGTKDGKPCPTVRDFSVVDQDQSDNTTTQYLITGEGKLAQDTPANRTTLGTSTTTFNGSDERLTSKAVDNALGCTPWTAPDLAGGPATTAWPLNELMAAARQAAPVALVPARDPFVMRNGHPDLFKLDAYRAGVDQPLVASTNQADTRVYCQNLLSTGVPRLIADQPYTSAAASPFPLIANSLFNFLAVRFQTTFGNEAPGLGCVDLLHRQNPVKVTTEDGVVTAASFDPNPPPA